MSATSPDTLERTSDGLYVTDEELIERLNVPAKFARDALTMFDKNPRSGFPPKQALWGGRRYWPAVKAYFDRVNGLRTEPSKERPRHE